MGEGLCGEPQDRSLPYSLRTNTAWVTTAKLLPHCVTGVPLFKPKGQQIWKSQVLSSLAEGPDSCQFTYLEPAALWRAKVTLFLLTILCSMRDQFSYKQQELPSCICCHWLGVHSGYQKHQTSSGTVACFHSCAYIYTKIFYCLTTKQSALHKVCGTLVFSPNYYLHCSKYMTTALLQQPENTQIYSPNENWSLRTKSLTFRVYGFFFPIIFLLKVLPI